MARISTTWISVALILIVLQESCRAVTPYKPNRVTQHQKSPSRAQSRGDLPDIPEEGENPPMVTLDWGLEDLLPDYDEEEEEEFIREIEEDENEEKTEKLEEKGIGKWRRWMNFRSPRHFSGSGSLSPFFNVDWSVHVILGDSWWEGPNVCQRFEESEETLEESHMINNHVLISSSRCDDTDTVYKCTSELTVNNTKKIMSVLYECCHGYQREHNVAGCTKKLPPMRGIVATLQSLDQTEIVKALHGLTLDKTLKSNNYTVFSPLSGLLKEEHKQNTQAIRITPELLDMAKTFDQVVSAHIVPDYVRTAHLEDEQVLPTLTPGSTIRINIYERPRRLVTANCQPITSSDNVARNGVVHLVDGTLPLVQDSIAGIISSNPDLSMFKTLIGQSGTLSMLKRDGQFTLLAPSNTAFSRLNPFVTNRLMAGEMCVTDVIKNHLMPNVICSSILETSEKSLLTINLLNNHLRVSSHDDKLFVDGAQILQKDIMGSNGVVHIIDDILIPKQAMTLPEVADALKGTTMASLIKQANLTDAFAELTNYTLFLPSNTAFQEIPEAQLQAILADPARLEELLHYHILGLVEESDDLYHGAMYDTLASGPRVRVNANKAFPFSRKHQTVQCARISKADLDTCDGIVHIVDRVLVPPSLNITEILGEIPEFSELSRWMDLSGLSSELTDLESLTFFAPTNRAIHGLDTKVWKHLENNPGHLKSVLKHHIIKGGVCCSDVGQPMTVLSGLLNQPTLEGSVVIMNEYAGSVKVNGQRIVECDIIATNGIVHAIDSMLMEAVNKYVRPNMRKPRGRFYDMSDILGGYLEELIDVLSGETSVPKMMPEQLGTNVKTTPNPFRVYLSRQHAKEKHPRGHRSHRNHHKNGRKMERIWQTVPTMTGGPSTMLPHKVTNKQRQRQRKHKARPFMRFR